MRRAATMPDAEKRVASGWPEAKPSCNPTTMLWSGDHLEPKPPTEDVNPHAAVAGVTLHKHRKQRFLQSSQTKPSSMRWREKQGQEDGREGKTR